MAVASENKSPVSFVIKLELEWFQLSSDFSDSEEDEDLKKKRKDMKDIMKDLEKDHEEDEGPKTRWSWVSFMIVLKLVRQMFHCKFEIKKLLNISF